MWKTQRYSGKEDIRVVHQDHLIHFEKSRAELFPDYGPEKYKRDPKVTKTDQFIEKFSLPKGDIFASDSSGGELELLSNLTAPSMDNSDRIKPSLVRVENRSQRSLSLTSTLSGLPVPSKFRSGASTDTSDRYSEKNIRRYPLRQRRKVDRLNYP